VCSHIAYSRTWALFANLRSVVWDRHGPRELRQREQIVTTTFMWAVTRAQRDVRGWSAVRLAAVLSVAMGVSACGGGGDADAPSNILRSNSSGTGYVAGVYMPATQFKGQCAAPRAGNPNDRPGSTLAENLWLRSWTNETYLWYGEVPDTDPSGYTTSNYFPLLKTSAVTVSGRSKDRFHFTYDTTVWESLAQSGVEIGYGAEWLVLSGSVPRRIVVAYTHANEPASRSPVQLQRGEEVRAVDGVDVDVATAAQLNAALWPATAGESHSFTLRSTLGMTRIVTMTSEQVTLEPVKNVTTIASNGGLVGYLQFNDHLAQSEAALASAISQLRTAGINDLVLDMRYNGGGYLSIASELAYMIAGPTLTSGRTFELVRFNDKNPTTNPVTGQAISPTPFYSTAQGFSVTRGTTLPTLNLGRVFLLTGSGTCSASESVINGLRGVGVEVIQIGSTTCGKPYGFYGIDNCGTTYFTIQFQTVNATGFGDYADGFSPANTSGVMGVPLPGCSVADDFDHVLGDPMEARLAAALAYRAGGTCPVATGLGLKHATNGADEGSLDEASKLRGKSFLRENRWD